MSRFRRFGVAGGGGLLGALVGCLLCQMLAGVVDALVPLVPTSEEDLEWFLVGVSILGSTIGSSLGVVIALWAPRKVRSAALGMLAGCAVGLVLFMIVTVIAVSEDSKPKGWLAEHARLVGPALLFTCAGLGAIAALLPGLFPRPVITRVAARHLELPNGQEPPPDNHAGEPGQGETGVCEAPSPHLGTQPR